MLLVSLVATGCSVEQEAYIPLDVSQENMTCVDAVKQYLDAADFKGK